MRLEFIEELEKEVPDINAVMRRLTEEIEVETAKKKNKLMDDYQQVSAITFVLTQSKNKNSNAYKLAQAMIEDLKAEYIKGLKNDSK